MVLLKNLTCVLASCFATVIGVPVRLACWTLFEGTDLWLVLEFDLVLDLLPDLDLLPFLLGDLSDKEQQV